MTRARSLKKSIRARAARTGESYTTARRHILAARTKPVSPATADRKDRKSDRPKEKEKPRGGGVSDARIRELTGHDVAHWFAVLDRFGAMSKGHTASAAHLYKDHGIPGWYAQGVTVAYERARGLRAVNQRADGAFEVSVSKVVPAPIAELADAITDRRQRDSWTRDADTTIARPLAAALNDARGKPFAIKNARGVRFRYRTERGTVELYLEKRSDHKTSIVAVSSKLPNAAAVEERRAAWRHALDNLYRYMTARQPSA